MTAFSIPRGVSLKHQLRDSLESAGVAIAAAKRALDALELERPVETAEGLPGSWHAKMDKGRELRRQRMINQASNSKIDRELCGVSEKQHPETTKSQCSAHKNNPVPEWCGYQCVLHEGHSGPHQNPSYSKKTWTGSEIPIYKCSMRNQPTPQTCGDIFTNCAGDTHTCQRLVGHEGPHAAMTRRGFETWWPQEEQGQCKALKICGKSIHRCIYASSHKGPQELLMDRFRLQTDT